MLTTADQYIAGLFWKLFGAGLVVFVTLFVAIDATSMSVKHNAGIAVLGSYYLFSIPEVIHQMLPVGCLVGTIFTLANMGRSNELTALFATGWSLARVSLPILVSVMVLCAANFVLKDRIVPVFNKKKSFIYYSEIEKKPWLYSTVKTNKIWYRSQNVLFNLRTLDTEARKAQDVTFYYFDELWDLVEMVTAKELVMNEGAPWELKDGLVTLFVRENSFPLTKSFETKTIAIKETVGDLQSSSNTAESLGVQDLGRFIKRNKDAGLDTLRYEVDYFAKFSFSFAAFVMAFIGIPMSVGRARQSGMALNMGATLGLAFLYWALHSSFLSIGKHGVVPPVIAAWTPNLLMLGFSWFLLLRLKR